jgi:hypothetical protein
MLSSREYPSIANVPGVEDLRIRLGFDRRTHLSARTKEFNDILKDYRHSYRRGESPSGIDINDWGLESHHELVNHMAQGFLEQHHGGQEFWPDLSDSPSSLNRRA